MGQAWNSDGTDGEWPGIKTRERKPNDMQGASGAGKTTLLNVLAERAPNGVVSGTKLVDAQFQDESFSRKIGYAQQQDLHLPTATVREALQFSALLRQPNKYSRDDKLAYADHVIDLLDMGNFADAVVGQPGEGKLIIC